MTVAIAIFIIDALLFAGLIAFVVLSERKRKSQSVGEEPDQKPNGDQTVLYLDKVFKDYGTGENAVHALKGVSLGFRKSEFVSILGQSGCGKTTMLNIVGGLDRYTSGDMFINGKSTKFFDDRDWDAYRNHSIGFVFQSYNLIPHQTVLQNVELALALSGVSKHERRERAKKALISVGLDTQFNKKPSEMSGGQMQRVAIARAIVNDPDIILADEPTGALDSETSIQVMEILKEISKDRLVIMVTHNPELAKTYSTRIVRMLDGVITEATSPVTATPFAITETQSVKRTVKEKKVKKPTMSFWTSFSLSLKNLFTKKGRTMLTSFAGSIGIIGIALIYAVSQGTTTYINHVQETTLASYPLTLQSSTIDLTTLMQAFMNANNGELDHDRDAVYKETVITELVNALAGTESRDNDLKSFKAYLDGQMTNPDSSLKNAVSGIHYSYDMELEVYTRNIDGKIVKSDTQELMTQMIGDYMLGVSSNGGTNGGSNSNGNGGSSSFMSGMMMGGGMWQELLPETDGSPINHFLKDQYDVIYGSWPNDYDELVLVVNENNELDDLTLYALGLLSEKEIDEIIDAAVNGTEIDHEQKSWSYQELCNMTFRTVLPADCYQKVGNTFVDISKTDSGLALLYENALQLKVTGIIRPSDGVESPMLSSGIGYTAKLTEKVIEKAREVQVVKDQLANPDTDVITGLPFKSTTGKLTDAEKEVVFREYIANMTDAQKAKAYVDIMSIIPEPVLDAQTESAMSRYNDKDMLSTVLANAIASQTGVSPETVLNYFEDMTLEELQSLMRPMLREQIKSAYADTVVKSLESIPDAQKVTALETAMQGYTTEQCATYYDQITVFSTSTYEENLTKLGCLDIDAPYTINLYASTFEGKEVIKNAITAYNDSVSENKRIEYTDYVGLMMSSITTIINAITYVLIAFVAVSLIVSSIMIGVITLISVQERTKEIGILRAIGASKRNVSGMFNAETMIIGFSSGAFGVIVTYLICIPINLILYALTGLAHLRAYLPPVVALVLITISVLLTLISGIIPSRSAAKKDPVVALRTE